MRIPDSRRLYKGKFPSIPSIQREITAHLSTQAGEDVAGAFRELLMNAIRHIEVRAEDGRRPGGFGILLRRLSMPS